MCPNTEEILRRIITLSVNESLSSEDIGDMGEGIRKVAEYYGKR
jgi:hypothetical protein